MKIIVLACLLFALPGQTLANVKTAELFSTINQRLSYMEDVALYKAIHHLPIEDVEREKVVLEKSKSKAASVGLDPQRIEGFFQAQIAVAKAIQYRHRADFLSTPRTRLPRDLKKEVRPALIKLGGQLIQRMMGYIEEHGAIQPEDFDLFDKAITIRFVTPADKRLLFNALLQVAPAS